MNWAREADGRTLPPFGRASSNHDAFPWRTWRISSPRGVYMSVNLSGRWMMRGLTCPALAVLWIASHADVAAAQSQGVRHVAVNLVAETRSMVPGQPFHVALRQQIEPGWHTYWSNPGDSGLPTAIDWLLPPDFKAGPILWPTPERFTVGTVVDYGYQHDILLPVTIEPPANLRPGSNVTISAHASWLVCSDTCIPEDAPVSLSVPVASIAEPDPAWAAAFSQARAQTPAPNPFPTTAIAEGDKLILHVATGDATGLRDVMFFAFAGLSFVGALLLALAGGIVLNLMPCVLPVLAIKAFGLVE